MNLSPQLPSAPQAAVNSAPTLPAQRGGERLALAARRNTPRDHIASARRKRGGAGHPAPTPAAWLIVALLAIMAGACAAPPTAAPAPAASPSAARSPIPVPSATPFPTAPPFILRPSATPPPPATLVSLDSIVATPTPDDYNPLTGLRLANPALLNRRPMAVKISNFPRASARPQYGLLNADHVYEYYLEDELTRFIGVFYGQDAERVGPVRSGRPFDEIILRSYKAILAFGFADSRIIQQWIHSDIAPFLVIEKPDNCPPMCRIGSPHEYNTLFTNTAQLSQYVSARGASNDRQALGGLHFGAAIATQRRALRMEIRFSPMSYHYWQYDQVSGRYLRWQDAERAAPGEETYQPLVDGLSGQQVQADNVIVLFVPVGYYFWSKDTEIYDIRWSGAGQGYALREGHIYPIEWKKPRQNDLVELSINGRPYPLRPGVTWFEMLDPNGDPQFSDTAWSFTYTLPPTPTLTPRPTRRP